MAPYAKASYLTSSSNICELYYYNKILIMKKIFTLIILAAVALTAIAGEITTNVTQTTNPAKEFTMLKSSEGSTPMNVYSELTVEYLGWTYTKKLENYFVECMIHPEDMDNVPIGAKITSIACGGEKVTYNGKESADSLYLAAYIKNDVDPETDTYTEGGYNDAKASYSADELYGPMTECGLTATEGEEAQVIHSDFDIAKPFEYTGNIFKVGLDIYAPEAVFFRYNTTNAVETVATTYHIPTVSGMNNICFYYDCEYFEVIEDAGIDMGMTFEPNKLPAFSLNYFTNDIKGVVTGAGGELVLTGGEGPITKTVASGEEFAFENVDYTKTYTLSLNGEVVAENLAFEDITKDIYVEVVAGGNEPVAGDVNGDGYVTSADVTALYDFLLNNDSSNIVNGDQDNDGNITAGDVTFIYNILLGNN